MFSLFFLGFHHFGLPSHLAAGHEWRTLSNRPGFPPAPFFHHQPASHFPPHMLALDRTERAGLGITNRKYKIKLHFSMNVKMVNNSNLILV